MQRCALPVAGPARRRRGKAFSGLARLEGLIIEGSWARRVSGQRPLHLPQRPCGRRHCSGAPKQGGPGMECGAAGRTACLVLQQLTNAHVAPVALPGPPTRPPAQTCSLIGATNEKHTLRSSHKSFLCSTLDGICQGLNPCQQRRGCSTRTATTQPWHALWRELLLHQCLRWTRHQNVCENE
jgi:hypothetical protein